MNRTMFALIFVVFISVCGVATAFAQAPTPEPTEKEKLVTQFRQLTGADRVNLRLDIDMEDKQAEFLSLVNSDDALTEPQKAELRKHVDASIARLQSEVEAFIGNRDIVVPISEKAIYELYDQAFTVPELKELVAFYSTTAGKKALQFLPTLSAQYQEKFQSILVPKVQEFITPKINSETAKLRSSIQEAKSKKP